MGYNRRIGYHFVAIVAPEDGRGEAKRVFRNVLVCIRGGSTKDAE
jgi:hypothetical protein